MSDIDNKKIGSFLRERGKKVEPDSSDTWLQEELLGHDKSWLNINVRLKSFYSRLIHHLTNRFTSLNFKKLIGFIRWFFTRKRMIIVALIGASTVFVFFLAGSPDTDPQSDIQNAALGASSNRTNNQILNTVEGTEFDLLYTSDQKRENTEVVIVSPPENDVVYAYTDEVGGSQISLSMQKLPKDFTNRVDVKIQELAESFQASNVIRIDDTIVYHGYSEKSGKQSIIFTKKGLLVLIASRLKKSDDVWAAYISSLR